MNKFLIKIAEEVLKESLPYRDRVEIIIVKNGEYLVTQHSNPDTKERWSGFPGGGVDGDPVLKACKKECLEEVGVRIKNIRAINIPSHKREGMNKKDNRHLKFRGSITNWYVADYDGIDKSKLGADNDSRRYTWQSLPEALQSVSKGKFMTTPRVNALKALKPVKSV
jgi:8-oxo-dGTP pyrophosphatase MutT (NUDIX family)